MTAPQARPDTCCKLKQLLSVIEKTSYLAKIDVATPTYFLET